MALNNNQVQIVLLNGAPRCVDRDTEYLSPYGWVPIGDYDLTGPKSEAAQFNPLSGAIEFVVPKAFIKTPAENLTQISTSKKGVSMVLSDDHMMVFKAQNEYIKSDFFAVKEHFDKYGDGYRFPIPTTFTGPVTQSVTYEDDILRLHTEIIMRGVKIDQETLKCVMVFKESEAEKRREITKLLDSMHIEYLSGRKDGEVRIAFLAPTAVDSFGEFYGAHSVQLTTIFERIYEYLNWKGKSLISSQDKGFIDFLQYILAAKGFRTTIHLEPKYNSYKLRLRTSEATISNTEGNVTTFSEYVTKDGFAYCFTVPSGMLVLRHNGCVFVTGNCGKDTFVDIATNQVSDVQDVSADTYKFSKPLKEATHRLFGLSVPHDFFEDSKDIPNEDFMGMSPRQAYILVDAAIKTLLPKDFFGQVAVRALKRAMSQESISSTNNHNLILISDSGFAEEAQPLIEEFGKDNVSLVKISRQGATFEGDSRGSIDLPGIDTYHIFNDGGLDEYTEAVRDTLKMVVDSRKARLKRWLN